jgi:hypothetical protein
VASPATYFKLLATALVWGATWIAGRVAVSEASPLAVASWRFLLAALVLGTLVVIHEGWPRWSPKEWLTLAALGASGIFLYNLCFSTAEDDRSRPRRAGGRADAGGGRRRRLATVRRADVADESGRHRLAMFGCLLVVTNGDPRCC